ncbi:MAG: citrate synthase [Clostridia bacterium]|nr:citrate synthase [Clostridia bacterium]
MDNSENQILLGNMFGFCDDIRKNYAVDPRHYLYGAVKRGLRNADGTGQLVGVTGVGSVQGYMMLDGEPIPMPGRLYYRGIDVREIVSSHIDEEVFGFEEVAYLLLMGELPKKDQLAAFRQSIGLCQSLPEGFNENIMAKAPSHSVMNMLSRSVLALYAYDEIPDDGSIENMVRQSLELIARVPVIAAHAYAHYKHAYMDKPLVIKNPRSDYSLAQNLMHMMRDDDNWTDEDARLLDILLTILAEHGGGTPSSFACRMLTSTGTDMYAAMSAAINVVKGRMDGGTVLSALNMFENILDNVSDMDDDRELTEYLNRILDGEANDGSGHIYGIGHAVYTQSDPRTILLKQAAGELAEKRGFAEKFRLMDNIERVAVRAISDRYTLRKPICANVDLYTGLVLRMLRIPDDLFEPLFCVSHVASWSAHRIEERLSGNRMMRPAYRCVAQYSQYVPIDKRG